MELIQNTRDWHKWRHAGMGGSDAPIIMGVSEFKTIHQLWEDKTGPVKTEDEPGFIQKKGHDFEAAMRPKVEASFFMKFPATVGEWHQDSSFRCSFDGLNQDNPDEIIVWECKLLGKDKFEALRDFGTVPDNYYPQLMHQALVAGASKIILTGGTDVKNYHHQEIKLEEEDLLYIKNELIPTLERFWLSVQNKTEPVLSPEDTVTVNNKELKKLLTSYKRETKKAKKAGDEVTRLKKEIFELTEKIHCKVECKGFKITVSTTEGKTVVDPAAYIKENNIDLFALGFTKETKPSTRKMITLPKE